MTINATHDPSLSSWVTSSRDEGCDFPIQNLPFGRFRRAGSGEAWRIGIAIGAEILDLLRAAEAPVWPDDVRPLLAPLAAGDLNAFMGQPAAVRSRFREVVSGLLADASPHADVLAPALVAQADAEMSVPCRIGDYTDFYTGIHHATAVGRLFRPDNPLMPNYKWVPIGYHGRASSVVVSGRPVRRPRGQTAGTDGRPLFGPARRLDYELELGLWVGPGNELGEPIAIDDAESHLFGIGLLNDWSARDVQAWEYQPLGPFLAKSFATTVSPWIVTMDALAPFRAAFERPAADPPPLPYLDAPSNREAGSIDIRLEAWLRTARMRETGSPAVRLSSASLPMSAYWTPAQLIAHHTVNGCNLQPGDLLGTGTLSGPEPSQGGSMVELTSGGKRRYELPNGEARTFLEDGDTVVLRAYCERPGAARIGFGEASATVVG